MRLGSDQIIPINIRIIAATNKRIDTLVAENKFREDLFFRLNVLTLVIPPLRERKLDIQDLAEEYCLHYSKNGKLDLTEDAVKALQEYDWPGNARQLKYFIEKVSVISNKSLIDADVIKDMLSRYEPVFTKAGSSSNAYFRPHTTKEEIEQALELCKGNRTKAAEILGIHRSSLWRLMKKHNIYK